MPVTKVWDYIAYFRCLWFSECGNIKTSFAKHFQSLRERLSCSETFFGCPSTLRQEESVKQNVACKRSPSFIFAFSSSFTSAYFSPTRYSMFVVHLVFVLWSFTLLICRVVYQWTGPHMKPCSTDDTPQRATCKETFYICINNLIFAEQTLVIASREKKEACKTITVKPGQAFPSLTN